MISIILKEDMALRKTLEYNGQLIQDAYIRIDHISGSKQTGWEATIGVYSAINRARPTYIAKVHANQVINSVAEMYDYLKTNHSDFVNSIDD